MKHAEPSLPSLPGLRRPQRSETRIGPLEISHGLYSVFLNEADECVRVLAHDINEWRYEPARQVSAQVVRRAHSLSGISKTIGLTPVIAIADPLDDLMHTLSMLSGVRHYDLTAAQFDTLERVIERMRGMLHQFAAGLYPDEAPLEAGALQDLVSVVRAERAARGTGAWWSSACGGGRDAVAELAPDDMPPEPVASAEVVEPDAPVVSSEPELPALSFEDDAAEPVEEPVVLPLEDLTPITADAPDEESNEVHADTDAEAAEAEAAAPRVRDEIDPDLLEVFLAEAADLLPAVGTALRGLEDNPNDAELARDLMRRLHTVKGSARMAGAMRLGELVHDMETRMEAAMQLSTCRASSSRTCRASTTRRWCCTRSCRIRSGAVAAAAAALASAAATSAAATPQGASACAEAPRAPVIDLAAARGDAKPETRAPALPTSVEATLPAAPAEKQAAPFIRVRADVLDKLVDQAGEVSIARSKLENEVSTIKGSLTDLTENIQRLRAQLREVEIQAEAQVQARGASLSRESSDFDPLEFDRYTRLQELTRMLAESVEDVAMVQSNMVKGLQMADTDLTSQSRLTRDLQQQLMRVRLVPFSNVSERLYRVARQTAKELDKRVNVDVRGGSTEIDRGVLEKMVGPFEHLIRNAIVHGLELPAERRAAGKAETGELKLDVRQEANEIIVVLSDDGAGLNLERIRERALERELISPMQELGDRELMDLIFLPGFTTATEVTELAGRGVGMDVVRAELASFGGRIAVSSESGRGTRFTLYLPMTLAVAQVVLVRIGTRRYALPAGMVEQVRRYRPIALLPSLAEGMIDIPPVGTVVLRPLSQLVGEETSGTCPSRHR